LDDCQESRESFTDRVNVADTFRTSRTSSLFFYVNSFTRSLNRFVELHIKTNSNRMYIFPIYILMFIFTHVRRISFYVSWMFIAIVKTDYESAEILTQKLALRTAGHRIEYRHCNMKRFLDQGNDWHRESIRYGTRWPCLRNAPAKRIVTDVRVTASRSKISKLLAVLGPVSSYGMSRTLPTCIIIELPGILQRRFRNRAVSSRWILNSMLRDAKRFRVLSANTRRRSPPTCTCMCPFV